MIDTRYENVNLAGRDYPKFNDAPHARPILSDDGMLRGLVILAGVLGGLSGLAAVLTLLR